MSGDDGGVRLDRALESHYGKSGELLTLSPRDRLAAAIGHSYLTIHRLADSSHDTGTTPDPRQVLRVQIRMALATILQDERHEAALFRAQMQKESPLGKGLIYTGAFFTGFGKATIDLATWVKDVYEVVSPNARAYRIFKSAHSAINSAADDKLDTFTNNLVLAEKREFVEALGFDPSSISKEHFEQAWEALGLIWSDPSLQSELERFAIDLVKAQHVIELTEFGGGGAFELVFDAILVAVTAGIGVGVVIASKLKHLRKVGKLGELLLEFAQATKKIKLGKKRAAGKGKKADFDDFEKGETVESRKSEPLPKSDKPTKKGKVRSFAEAEQRLKQSRAEIKKRMDAGQPAYKPKYSDDELVAMANSGTTANERFLVSVQPLDPSPDAPLSFQRESGLVPTWTTSFDQLEAADTDPKLLNQVIGNGSWYNPEKDYVMHIIDRGENLDQFGNNTVVPTWENLNDVAIKNVKDHSSEVISSTMNSNYQSDYAENMKTVWSKKISDFDPDGIEEFASTLPEGEAKRFLARHNVRTELGANAEFTGNGLTANTANGGGQYGVVETLSIERDLPKLKDLQSPTETGSPIVKTINLTPIK